MKNKRRARPITAMSCSTWLVLALTGTWQFVAASSVGDLNLIRPRELATDTRMLSRRDAIIESPAELAYTNSTAAGLISPRVVTKPASNQARYGHSAVYLRSSKSVMFIGGQLDVNSSETAEITNQVLSLDLASVGDAQDVQPDIIKHWSKYLPATAWAAAALDSNDQIWLLGGLTADCSKDATTHVFDGTKWSAPNLLPRLPPRRRQTRAVAVANSNTGGTDIFVFGGIAERETCSEGTIGYRGIDRYDTVTSTVETFGWQAPSGANTDFEPPLSDYSAILLADGKTIAVVGGQTASGELASMKKILLFDTVRRKWKFQGTTGLIPSGRMGHVAIQLANGAILVHGGLNDEAGALKDVLLLTPSGGTSAPWTWSKLLPSEQSLPSIARAWHTATLTESQTVIVAFGLDTAHVNPPSSSNILFLRLEDDGRYTWSTRLSVPQTRLRLAQPVQAIVIVPNPKAQSVVTDEAPSAELPAPWTPPVVSSQPTAEDSQSSAPATSRPLSSTASSFLSEATSDSASSGSSSVQTSTTIGATLGSLAGLLALVGVGAFVIRRRRAAGRIEPDTPGTMTAPFVSALLYTRPAQKRMLSLGSTLSARHSIADSEGLDDHSIMGTSQGPTGGRETVDPFADPSSRVSEMGEMQQVGGLKPPATAGARTGLADLSPSVASVASIPYLSALARIGSRDSDSSNHRSPPQQFSQDHPDVYTSPPPALAARKSLRRPTSTSSLPSSSHMSDIGATIPSISSSIHGHHHHVNFARPLQAETGLDLFGPPVRVRFPIQQPQPTSLARGSSGSTTGADVGRHASHSSGSSSSDHATIIPEIPARKANRGARTPLRVTNADPVPLVEDGPELDQATSRSETLNGNVDGNRQARDPFRDPNL